MSWKITSINNATHDVTITHHSGEAHSFSIPEEHQERGKKLSYIYNQISEKESKYTDKAERKFNLFKYIAIVESILLAALIGLAWARLI